MQVSAISTPRCPDWRWRILGYDGEVIEESSELFPTIAAAIAQGTERLARLNAPEPRRW